MCWDCYTPEQIVALTKALDDAVFDRLIAQRREAQEGERARERSMERLRALSRPHGYLPI